jgi:hypothetical protein
VIPITAGPVTCDGCRATLDDQVVTGRDDLAIVTARVDLREAAIAAGWARAGGGDWCPACAGRAIAASEASAEAAGRRKAERAAKRRAAREAKGGAA